MENEFVDIVGFSKYKINRLGQVLNIKKNKLISIFCDDKGYKKINLYGDDGIRKTSLSIHRLLALTFIPNPNNYPCVDHIDRNPKNNSLSNLRWCTHQFNDRNKNQVYNQKGGMTIRNRRNKITYEFNYYIDYQTRKFKSFDNIEDGNKWIEEMKINYPRNIEI